MLTKLQVCKGYIILRQIFTDKTKISRQMPYIGEFGTSIYTTSMQYIVGCLPLTCKYMCGSENELLHWNTML
jgi:hypothetical protein